LPVDPTQPVTASAESAGGWVNAREREKALNVSGPEQILRRMEVRMLAEHQLFLAEYGGQMSLAALRAAVSALSLMPGRKSIVYLTEHLPITDRLKPRFDALIGEANRHNVTVYAVDAGGLRVHSKEAEVGRGMDVAGAQGIGDARREDGPWTRDLERQSQLLSSRPTVVLGRLTKDTGGFLLENTNDLARGVGRMQQERTQRAERRYAKFSRVCNAAQH
jgi:VWFA-related protein